MWQWRRVTELYNVGGRANTFPQTLEEYNEWIDHILATPPRKWEGFNAADQLMVYYDFQEALPPYIGDHWNRYWTAHLMPHKLPQSVPPQPRSEAPWRCAALERVDRCCGHNMAQGTRRACVVTNGQSTVLRGKRRKDDVLRQRLQELRHAEHRR